MYTCVMASPCGNQEKVIAIDATGNCFGLGRGGGGGGGGGRKEGERVGREGGGREGGREGGWVGALHVY